MKRITVKNILSSLALSIAGLTVQSAALAETVMLDRVAAIVNEDVVTTSELQDRVAQIINQNQGQQRRLPPREVIEQQVLDRLIVESIQIQMGQRAGVRISDQQLNETLARIAQRNGLTLEQFRLRLEQEGQSYQQAREQIRKEMILSQVQQGNLRNRIEISEQEVENFLASAEGQEMMAARYQLAHLLLPGAKSDSDRSWLRELGQQISKGAVSFEQVLAQGRYQGRDLEGGDLGMKKAEELPSLFANEAARLEPGEISPPVRSGAGLHLIKLVQKQGGDNQLIKQTHVRHILIKPSAIRDKAQAKAFAEELRQRIVNGEDFGDLAKQYSEDPGSALQGGDLSWASPGMMVPSFENMMDNTAIDAVSPVFESDFGWHILQVLGRRDHDISAERWRQQAQNIIYERKYDEELTAWLQKIRDEAFVDIKL